MVEALSHFTYESVPSLRAELAVTVDGGGLAYWSDLLEAGTASRAQVIVAFSDSDENRDRTDTWLVNPLEGDRLDQAAVLGQARVVNQGSSMPITHFSYRDLASDRSDYQVSILNGIMTVRDTASSAETTGAETVLEFSDGTTLVHMTDEQGATMARLYQAMLGRSPDVGGLNYWIDHWKGGQAPATLALGFLNSIEFAARFGDPAQMNNTQFATTLYENVLGRAPEAAGLAYWVDHLESESLSRAEVITMFSDSPENRARTDSWLINPDDGDTLNELGLDQVVQAPEPAGNDESSGNAVLDGAGWTANVVRLDDLASSTDRINTFDIFFMVSPVDGSLNLALSPETGKTIYASDTTASVISVSGGSHVVQGGDAPLTVSNVTAATTVYAGAGPATVFSKLSLMVVHGFGPGDKIGTTAWGRPEDDVRFGDVSAALTADLTVPGYAISMGSMAGADAAAVAAGLSGLSVSSNTDFIAVVQDGSDAEVYEFRGNDANGNGRVDASEMVHVMTLIGFNSAFLTVADFAG